MSNVVQFTPKPKPKTLEEKLDDIALQATEAVLLTLYAEEIFTLGDEFSDQNLLIYESIRASILKYYKIPHKLQKYAERVFQDVPIKPSDI